ncbi:MAG: tRNA (N6-isopentenyl adenosine(37)-C2)-methylthiotransferase MiaB [Burkholderiaceae bacterium]|nr:MAG: tRNA (N6-isopentenyl adenosine(37)-C2)-methylthiotransferase MiaB [Burkholderiaceae bacterium]
MDKKLYIKTYGCQMNEYDSGKISDLLAESNTVSETSSPDEADIILFNTCSVREKAEEKVFSDLGRIKHLKRKNPNLIVGVGGCVASQEGTNIVRRAPYVDIVFGPQTLHRIPSMIRKVQKDRKSQIDISFPEIEKFDHLPTKSRSSATAFVSIMEGCSKYCSFCVVPYTRGTEFSRSVFDIIPEVRYLVNNGVKEITFLGQNVNAYYDRKEKLDFASLLELTASITGLERIRYTSSHPREVTSSLIKAYKRLPKLVDQLHLPVQSGSDKVLSAMKRGYTALEYKSIIKKLRLSRPSLSLTSDFIVGFPGETDDDFEKTLKLVDELKFDGSYSFAYSDRPGTPASQLPNKIDKITKFTRLKILQEKLDKYALHHSYEMLGKNENVLIEGLSKRNLKELMGRTQNNRVVNLIGPTNLIGKIIPVLITDVKKHSLRGELI